MARCVTAAVAAALLAGAALGGGDAPAKKPLGTWVRTAGDNRVEFHIKANGLRTVLTVPNARLEIDADYGVSQDGILFGRVSKVEAKGVDNPPPVGHLFSFRYTRKDGNLTISDLKGTESDEARRLIEGDYKAEKK